MVVHNLKPDIMVLLNQQREKYIMKNVFKKALFNHKFDIDEELGIVSVQCEDEDDRDYLIIELQEMAYNMKFFDYELITNELNTNLEILL